MYMWEFLFILLRLQCWHCSGGGGGGSPWGTPFYCINQKVQSLQRNGHCKNVLAGKTTVNDRTLLLYSIYTSPNPILTTV